MYRSGPQVANLSLRYQTKYHDIETNSYYYGIRHYDPATCRWLSRDPLEEQGGYNLYAFVNNDPINGIDYLGLAEINDSGLTYRPDINNRQSHVSFLDYIMPHHAQIMRREPLPHSVMNTLDVGSKMRTVATITALSPYAAAPFAQAAIYLPGPTMSYVVAQNFIAATPWAAKTVYGLGLASQAMAVGTFIFGDDDTRAQMMSVPGGPMAVAYSGANLITKGYKGTKAAVSAISAIPKLNPANYSLKLNSGLGSNLGNVSVKYTSKVVPTSNPLASPGEDLFVGPYSQSYRANVKAGVNLTHTPHHSLQNAVSNTTHGRGITINLSKDLHSLTRTFRRPVEPGLTSRQHLARDIIDLRNILKGAGYDQRTINASLQELIKQNKDLGGL